MDGVYDWCIKNSVEVLDEGISKMQWVTDAKTGNQYLESKLYQFSSIMSE